jgi:hypothetical protein
MPVIGTRQNVLHEAVVHEVRDFRTKRVWDELFNNTWQTVTAPANTKQVEKMTQYRHKSSNSHAQLNASHRHKRVDVVVVKVLDDAAHHQPALTVAQEVVATRENGLVCSD